MGVGRPPRGLRSLRSRFEEGSSFQDRMHFFATFSKLALLVSWPVAPSAKPAELHPLSSSLFCLLFPYLKTPRLLRAHPDNPGPPAHVIKHIPGFWGSGCGRLWGGHYSVCHGRGRAELMSRLPMLMGSVAAILVRCLHPGKEPGSATSPRRGRPPTRPGAALAFERPQ